MGARFGTLRNLAEFERAIFLSLSAQPDVVTTNPVDVAVDLAREALNGAGVPAGSPVAIGLIGPPDGETLAADIAQRCDVTCQAAARSDPTCGLNESLDLARSLLGKGAEVVLLVGLEASGEGAAVVLANVDADLAKRPYAFIQAASPERGRASLIELEPAAQMGAANWLAPDYAAGSVAANIGRGQAAGGVAGLVRAALAVSYGYFPAGAGWPAAPAGTAAEAWLPVQSQPWFVPSGGRRIAAVVDGATHGTSNATFVTEAVQAGPRFPAYSPVSPRFMLQATGRDVETITAALLSLEQTLAAGADPWRLAKSVPATPEDSLVVALLSHDRETLIHEIDLAKRGVPEAIRLGGTWQTPQGSYFTTEPVGRQGGVAFVYPGAFSAYPGMARDVFRVFPQSHAALSRLVSDPGKLFAKDIIFPRVSRVLNGRLLSEYESRLLGDAPAMMESGTACAAVYTHLLRDVIGIHPSASLGYSLGETTMLWALGVWADGDEGHARFRASDLFRTRLGGPLETVRSYRAAAGYFNDDPDQWGTFTLLASPDDVQDALSGFDLAFLTMINSAQEVVIAGDPGQCIAVAEHIGCEAVRMRFNYPLHCPVTMVEVAEFSRLNLHPTQHVEGISLYSACDYSPLPMESRALADAVARMSCKQLDYPRLVDQVYADGARVFIEIGPSGSCTRLIDAILAKRPHLATAIDRRGSDVESSVFRVLAQLVSHRVPFDRGFLLAGTA